MEKIDGIPVISTFVPILILILFWIMISYKTWKDTKADNNFNSKIVINFKEGHLDKYWCHVALFIGNINAGEKKEWFQHSDDKEPFSGIHLDEWLEKSINELKEKEKILREIRDNGRKTNNKLKEKHKDYEIILHQEDTEQNEEDKNGADRFVL